MHSLSFIALILIIVLSGCEGHTLVRGTGCHANGMPIKNAAVKLAQQRNDEAVKASTTETDDDGKYRVGHAHAARTNMPLSFG